MTLQRYVVTAAAWLEIVVGVLCITVVAIPCRLLFAVEPEGVAMPLGRFAGVALTALGIGCLPSKTGSYRSAVLGLLAYNSGAAILFASVGFATAFRGPMLWPAAILHAVIAIALLVKIRQP
jgi:hypothetical protein